MFSTFRITTVGLFLLAVGVMPAQAALNLVADPGFESCPGIGVVPPAWSATQAGLQTWICDNSFPNSGISDASDTSAPGALSQVITGLIPGNTYDFSFFLDNESLSPNSFVVSFGSDQVLTLTNAAQFNYTLEDFKVTATAASEMIAFTASQANGGWGLDDVSVTLVNVPEPASLTLLAVGLAGLGMVLRTRRV